MASEGGGEWQVQGLVGRAKKISKIMAYILRHGAEYERLLSAKNGYLPIQVLINDARLRKLKATREDVAQIVMCDKKSRFHIIDGGDHIRANQGHSLQSVLVNMKEITNPVDVPVAVHGTHWEAWDHIERQGLSVMRRQHIHFASGTPEQGDVISGMRSTCQALIYADIPKMLSDGIKVYRSSNGVILTRGIDGVLPTKYFERVVHARKGTVIFTPPAAAAAE